jgi:fructokinase
LIVGIETGGTKVICATADENRPLELIHTWTFGTTTPHETIGRINNFLSVAGSSESLSGIGVASFGPLNVDSSADRYGWITATTKPGWSNSDLIGGLHVDHSLIAPIVTDVAGAALGESFAMTGATEGSLAYATFGTGVGVGLLVNGALMQGNGYPEMAHIRVERHRLDRFEGICPFHGGCLEGLASGPAVLGRWGADASSLHGDDAEEARNVLGWYIAQLLTTLAFTFGPLPVVLGGGVLKTPGLLEVVREEFMRLAGGALPIGKALDELVSVPHLGDYSGVSGALVLASKKASTSGVPRTEGKVQN